MSDNLWPHISVVIPTYNRGHLVRTAVNSVLAQTYRGGFEVIVVDDGSGDDTVERLSAYGDQIRVVRRGKRGTQRRPQYWDRCRAR
jgi:glycosyltransferase involved in cell wall biosynthesis